MRNHVFPLVKVLSSVYCYVTMNMTHTFSLSLFRIKIIFSVNTSALYFCDHLSIIDKVIILNELNVEWNLEKCTGIILGLTEIRIINIMLCGHLNYKDDLFFRDSVRVFQLNHLNFS